jgi:hypothetical protein
LDSWQRMLYESSFSVDNTPSTMENYLSEIRFMPPCEEKDQILAFLNSRKVLLSAVAGHDKQE